jgi:hypothetical protein
MAQFKPSDLVLRCYGHRVNGGRWFGVCVDLNLAAEADSRDQLKEKLYDVIVSYIETVLETDDKDSIPSLLSRRAPINDWLKYYFIKSIISIRNFPDNFTFQELIPFHLSGNC